MRTLTLSGSFDLARTAAPVWWASGRWPNVDWKDGAFYWVGWEDGQLAWRSVRQSNVQTLEIRGKSRADLDAEWASAVLGTDAVMPRFADPVLGELANHHAGLRPWSVGSLFEGVVSSIVGQSISVAAAATTERRLFEIYTKPLAISGRLYWPPPQPDQLASSSRELVRNSGVTTRRAEALIAVGELFASGSIAELGGEGSRRETVTEALLAIAGIGPWTVQSALLWGVADPDSHPTGDVALLRASKRHYSTISNLKDLDELSERWKPFRAWAARLLWLDLLGYDQSGRDNHVDMVDNISL